jgi:hypothetical protein
VNGTFACQGAPCAVTLEVYDDDRTTILWEVGTNPAHANPYLCLPENYGEQEIDVVRGAATIGQVEAVIIDRRQTAGDQDSGWLTDKLADRIHGRRCRMRRFVSEDIGWVTIADGPAGTPRLDASFAAYHFVIRDTRETERKVRAFVTSDTTSLLPLGITNGFGLIPAVTPLSGPYITGLPAANALIDFAPGYWTGTVGVDAVVDDAVVISAEHEAMVQATRVEDIGGGQFRNHYDNVKLLWRIAGSMAAYTEWATPVGTYSDDTARPLVAVFDALKVTGQPVRAAFVIQSDAIPGAPALDTEDLEVIIVPVDAQPTSSQWPLHIDGLTAGEFLTNLYDGLYSPRDSSGNIVPTGIRYDAAALLAMTTQVTLRVTEPIDDARAWAEEFIYAPTGWCPALDNDARISPVSQIPPLSTAGLTDINGAITEPVPGWHAGERVINIVEYEYPRHYIPADSSVPVDGDGLATRTQRITDTTLLHSETSIERHGEQKVDFNGLAFAAIGSGIGEPLGYPQDPDAIQTELGYQLAYERGLYILPRYEEGAQAIDVPVMRSATATLRAGDWVLANLAWFPNYITRRRGQTDMIGQIMAIADLDCAWRQLLIEEGPPTIPPADVELEDSVGVWDELDVVSITPVDLEDTAGVDETLDIIAEITVEDAFAPSLLPPAFVAVRTNQSETPTSLYRYSIEIFDNTDPIELEFYVKIAGVWQLEDTITFLTAGRHDINIPPVGSVGDPDVEEFRILDLNVQEPIAWTAIGVSWTYQTPIASL